MSDANANWYGAIGHTEFGSTDVDATTAFLGKVFGLKFDASKDSPMPYFTSYRAGEPSCGVRPVMEEEPGPSATPYFLSEDIQQTVADAEAGGAKIVLPPTEIPGVGTMAWMQIPGGPTIATMQVAQG